MVLVLGTQGQYNDCGPNPVPTAVPTPGATLKTIKYDNPGAPYNWTLPDDAASATIILELVGGGGGGAGGSVYDGQCTAGGSGKAGQWLQPQSIDIIKGNSYAINVGAGGTGGGGAGTQSRFYGENIDKQASGGTGGTLYNSYNPSSGQQDGYGNGGAGGNCGSPGYSGNNGAVIITYTAYVQ